jgi:hypothetical protein
MSIGKHLLAKQYYHYVVEDWLKGDVAAPKPPTERKWGRNREWFHFYADDILSMCDKWEYPWFAAWDLSFHCLTLAMIDLDNESAIDGQVNSPVRR